METNKRIGETYLYNNEPVTIIDVIKGGIKNKNSFHRNNRKRNPPTYILSNGHRVRFDKLEKYVCFYCNEEKGKHKEDCIYHKSNQKYGLCQPPITAEKGLDLLIKHFLGDNWYSALPMSTEQCYTEAVITIIENNKKYKEKSLFDRIFNI